MQTSYNGWPASPNLKTRLITPVPGVSVRVLDNENVVSVFTYLIKQYDARVEPVAGHIVDDWGFAFRPNANDPTTLSCHASATAVDINAMQHPNNTLAEKTLSLQQIQEIHKILAELDGVVRWGGDFRHTVDPMHFEICVLPGQLQEIGAKLRKDQRKKTLKVIANEVIAGKWGNAPERKARLTAAGYDYYKVQEIVKKKLADQKRIEARKKNPKNEVKDLG